MIELKEVNGDLIVLAKQGKFNVIAHGCNCFCQMGSGLAPQMAAAFGCDKYLMEDPYKHRGNMNKLGSIDYKEVQLDKEGGYRLLYVVNCYTQFSYRTSQDPKPLDYNALVLCFKKMNHVFRGHHIGLPEIGCHLAGGDWPTVKSLIIQELKDCQVTVVHYVP